MTDLVPAIRILSSNELILPTGELVNLNDTAAAARGRAYINQLTDALADARAVVDASLVAASEREGTKTLRAGGYLVEIHQSSETVWDIEGLRDRLRAVACPEERIDALIRQETVEKVNGNVARQLAGANNDYRAALAASKDVYEKRPYAKVTPL